MPLGPSPDNDRGRRGGGSTPARRVQSCGMRPSLGHNAIVVNDALRFTIRYSDGGEGWVMAQVEEVPGALSQGRTREEARQNVIDALRLMLKPEPDHTVDPDRESLDLPLAS